MMIMAKIAKNLTELIGGTPLMKLAGYSRKYGLQQDIVAKLESFNPAGSVKDRVGLAMIEDAEARGVLKPGATIIEPTSGNTGVGLAMVATIKGYHLMLTMPETMSIERRNLLKALGAEIVLTDGMAGMAGSIAKAKELRDRIPGAVILQQFENPSNAKAHELTTGEEIWRDTDGQVDVFVAGVGTGGTVCGAARALKKHNPDIYIVAVEPARSDQVGLRHELLRDDPDLRRAYPPPDRLLRDRQYRQGRSRPGHPEHEPHHGPARDHRPHDAPDVSVIFGSTSFDPI